MSEDIIQNFTSIFQVFLSYGCLNKATVVVFELRNSRFLTFLKFWQAITSVLLQVGPWNLQD